jgi:hypothetical protein
MSIIIIGGNERMERLYEQTALNTGAKAPRYLQKKAEN